MEYLNFMARDFETQTQQTPMGRVWLIVLVSMVLVFGASWLWHLMGMSEQKRRNSIEDAPVVRNIEAITRYRDVLKEKGKAGGILYLTATSSQH